MGCRRDRRWIDLSSPSTTVSAEPEPATVGAAHTARLPLLRDRVRKADNQQRALWAAWIVSTLAGLVWLATQYRGHWFYYDEWTTIDRSFGSWIQMFSGHQGHLEVFSYIVYRLQRSWLGLEGHQLVWLAFMASVAAFHVSVGVVLTRLRVPPFLALLAATLITYFGIGGQSVTWEFQLGINFALAACFAAAFVALGPGQSRREAIIVGALLLFALGADSGLAIMGSIFVGLVILIRWPWRIGIPALVPAALGQMAWFVFGDQGADINTTFDRIWEFATDLFLLGAGGLVGGGETSSVVEAAQGRSVPADPVIPVSGVTVGAIVLALAGVCVVYAFVRRRVDRTLLAGLVGGGLAAVVTTASIAETRAFFQAFPAALPGTRWVQWVAVFQLIALMPIVVVALRSNEARRNRFVAVVAGIALIGALALSIDQLGPVNRFSKQWGAGVKLHVAEAISVVEEGCGRGQRLDPDAMPIPDLAPQITVAVLQEVRADGALPARWAIPAPREMREVMCRSVGSAP